MSSWILKPRKTSCFTFRWVSHSSIFWKITDSSVLGIIGINLHNCWRSLGKVQDAVDQWGPMHILVCLCFLQRQSESNWRITTAIDDVERWENMGFLTCTVGYELCGGGGSCCLSVQEVKQVNYWVKYNFITARPRFACYKSWKVKVS